MSDTWKSKETIRLVLSIVLLVIGIILLAAPQAAMVGIVISVSYTHLDVYKRQGEGYFRLTAFNTKENTEKAIQRLANLK